MWKLISSLSLLGDILLCSEACTDNLSISADLSPAYLLHSSLSEVLSSLLKTWFTAGSS